MAVDEVVAGPVMGETFFSAQRRHRRTARFSTVLAALAAVVQGIPIAVILSPVFIGAAVLVADVVNLWRPAPDLGAQVARAFVDIAENSGLGLGSGPQTASVTEFVRALLDLVTLSVPGLLVLLVLWWLVRRFMLRDGLGGVLVAAGGRPPNRMDDEEHQLVNVVAEISISAGVRPPRVLVLPADVPNAAAFGRSPQTWTIAVSRGLLDDLDRDATQGVIAHLVGSVGNGDLRMQHSLLALYASHQLAQDLIAVPFARRARERVRLAGRLLRGKASPVEEAEILRRLLGVDDDKNSANVFLSLNFLAFKIVQFYTNTVVIGAILALPFRARRYLADAAAVQLTRSPGGLGRALVHLRDHGADLPGAGYAAIYTVTAEAGPGHDDRDALVLPSSLHPSLQSRIARLRRLGFRHVELPAGEDRADGPPFGRTWPAPLRRLALVVVWIVVVAAGLPLSGLFVVAVITGIGLSVQLGFSCWAVVTAAVVTPLHLVLRVLA